MLIDLIVVNKKGGEENTIAYLGADWAIVYTLNTQHLYICFELQRIASHFKRVISRQWHSCLEHVYPVFSEADKPKLRLFSQLIVTPTPYNMGLNGDAAFG